MISNADRRDVARRLRALDYSDLQESLICAYLDALGIDGYEDWVGIAHHLADLIEPGDTSQSCRDTVACDRDALLALADRMEHMAGMGALLAAHGLAMAAASIREACGEVEE